MTRVTCERAPEWKQIDGVRKGFVEYRYQNSVFAHSGYGAVFDIDGVYYLLPLYGTGDPFVNNPELLCRPFTGTLTINTAACSSVNHSTARKPNER